MVKMSGTSWLGRACSLSVPKASMIRGSCYVFETTEQACLFARWIEQRVPALKAWLEETGVAPAHFFLEGNTGGDKKPSHLRHIARGHGRTVLASCVLTETVAAEVLECSLDDLVKLREVGTEGGVLAGMLGTAVNPVNVIAAAGSLSFYTAHLERGGMRRSERPAQVAPALVDQLRKDG
jgi:hydroxymethylglutaryl-CoA reductase